MGAVENLSSAIAKAHRFCFNCQRVAFNICMSIIFNLYGMLHLPNLTHQPC